MDSIKDNIIDRVNNLLKLASNSASNINEAAAATKAAELLIAKHRISEAELQSKTDKKSEPVRDSNVLYETARVTKWKVGLVNLLSEHYGCAVYNDLIRGASEKGNAVSRYRLVGQQSDIDLTRFMFGWLTNEIERLSRLNCKGQGKIAAQSYCEGAVIGVKVQLKSAREEAVNEAKTSGQTTALLALDSRLEESISYMKNLVPGLRTVYSKSYRQIDKDAYHAGERDGKKIHLAKGLGAGTNSKLLT